MKKILLTTTALTILSGAAYAEMGVSGDARFGVTTSGGVSTVDYRTRVFFKGAGETDGGLTFGAKTGLRLDDGAVSASARVIAPSLYLGNGTMTLRIGNTNGAISTASGIWNTPGVGYSGMSFGGVLFLTNSSSSTAGAGANNVAVDFSLGTTNISLSQTNGGDVEIAASMKAGSATIGVGYDNGATTTGGTYLTAAFDAGGANIAVAYVKPTTGAASWSLGGSSAMGSGSAKAFIANIAGTSSYGIGYGASLGGGASWGVGFESIAGVTRMEAGMNFGF